MCYIQAMSGICPICQKTAQARDENAAWPFCCPRCKQIDLGKWLGGEYRIATNERAEGTSNEETAAGNREDLS